MMYKNFLLNILYIENIASAQFSHTLQCIRKYFNTESFPYYIGLSDNINSLIIAIKSYFRNSDSNR